MVELRSQVILLAVTAVALQAQASIRGRVTDPTGTPLPAARLHLAPEGFTASTAVDGSYRFGPVSPGRHILSLRRLGFAPIVDTIAVAESDLVHDYTLAPIPQLLSQVTVTPGSYSILDLQAPSRQVIDREELLTRPQLAEDLFRTLNRLPGFSGSDFSAQLRVRNSSPDELLVMLDGMELLEPFHLKDFDGALTIVDQDAVGAVEINTGGFGASFGNRSSGLLLMRSPDPATAGRSTTLSLSLSNVRFRSTGAFAAGRGSWQLSARRGYLDIILGLLGEEDAPDPTYYDVFARADYRLGRHLLRAHTLIARDQLAYAEDDGNTTADSRYGNAYGWLTAHSQWTDRIRSTSLLGLSALSWHRDGKEAEFFRNQPYVRAAFRDRRALDVVNGKQDFTWDLGPRVSATWGAEARRESADYDYLSYEVERARVGQTVVVRDSSTLRLEQATDGWRMGGYASVRARVVAPLTVDLGARVDRHTWTGVATVTPRLSARWDVGARTSFRAAWGTYAQAQGLHELSVIDGDSLFARPERTEQRVVGVEHTPVPGLSFRTEVYQRRVREPRPRWLNADGELDPFPEGQPDRFRFAPDSTRVRGTETLVTWDRGSRLRVTGWYNYLRGEATLGALTTDRPFEERHSGAIDLALRWPSGVTAAVAWSFHSGWPVIPAAFRVDTLGPSQFDVVRRTPQPPFTERLDGYQRLDVRASRRFQTRRGVVSTYLEVFNLLDRANHRGWEYDAFFNAGQFLTARRPSTFVGRLPTIGVRWEF